MQAGAECRARVYQQIMARGGRMRRIMRAVDIKTSGIDGRQHLLAFADPVLLDERGEIELCLRWQAVQQLGAGLLFEQDIQPPERSVRYGLLR